MHVADRCGIDVTLARKNLRRDANRFSEVSGDFCQRREKQISKTVTAEFAVTTKTITEESRQQSRVFRERDHAVADVAGGSICSSSRRRPELPPSSETVTIAERLSIQISSSVLPTRRFRPASKVERPVPPPMATSF